MSEPNLLNEMIIIALILITLITSSSSDASGFLETCPQSTCGSLQIRYPLRLRPGNPSCSFTGLDLICSDNKTLLLPAYPQFKITHINYATSQFTLYLGSIPQQELESSPCPLQNLSDTVSSINSFNYQPLTYLVSFIQCPRSIESLSAKIAGPVKNCYSTGKNFVYAVVTDEFVDKLPRDCEVFLTGGMIPLIADSFNNWADVINRDFEENVDKFTERKEVNIFWYQEFSYCSDCAVEEKYCGLDWAKNQTFCFNPEQNHHRTNVLLITGPSVTGLVILLAVSFAALYVSRRSAKERQTWLKVEKFLSSYKTTKPTRYSYAGIKEITKRFRHKLGKGGFGTVYKGELKNGIPVAVKMLEYSKGEGEEFINEVATMGRIHHVNIVRLLGFCSEGTRRALIYEYMPNESLEKYIYSKEAQGSKKPLNIERIFDVTIGIARGIEYLHHGGDQRIMHFDIKPHNILLDHNFNPKVSDFGLAKLCARDQSMVTMTAARGTMGYIAPEFYSRNFGEVSYKSDIYSFGMVLLEMVSGKRTVEPKIDKQDDDYFPEWIYDRLINAEDLGLVIENEKEKEIAKKLVIVALWCIQLSANDRPTMTRVIQLLTGELESLQFPPKPFISAYNDNG